eukprot:m.180540 g.180540  ORF g.180540 m.180540 type:complete len:477 (+) comp18423_c0_seq2:192-1622(+)
MSILGRDTISVFAEACGVSDLSEDVATILAADLEYRLREITQEAAKFARHSKRRKLHTEDINMALRLRNIEPLYGYSTLSGIEDGGDPRKHGFKRAGVNEAFYIPDRVIDLEALVNADLPKLPVDVTYTTHWLAIEGVQPEIPQNPPVVEHKDDSKAHLQSTIVSELNAEPTITAIKQSATAGSALNADGENVADKAATVANAMAKASRQPVVMKTVAKHELSLEQQLYYRSVTEGLLDNKDAYCRQAFDSLCRDPGLHALLPYFSQFVAEKVLSSLGNLGVLTNMVQLTASLLRNPNLFPEPYLHQLLPAMLTCVVGKSLSKNPEGDHWTLREQAAAVVETICRRFGKHNRVQSRVTKTMIGAILDPTKPLSTQYGAIVTLTKLGPLVIDALLMDNLKTYHENTLGKSKASVDLQERTDARMVENALVNACNVYLKWDQEINKVPAATTPLPQPNVERRNKVMRELFGDKLSLLS